MPAPVVHIARAQQWLAKNPGIDPAPFLRGTIFPDIRFLGRIPREVTHRGPDSLRSVHGASDAFEAGRRFHCLVDHIWKDFFRQNGHAQMIQGDRVTVLAAKIIEALVVAPTIEHREIIAGWLGTIDTATSKEWGLEAEHVRAFQNMVAGELLAPFDLESRMSYLDEIDLGGNLNERVKDKAREIAGDVAWRERIVGLEEAIGEATSS